MIEAIAEINFEEVLPLIRKYQEFYQVANIDEAQNRLFFCQFGEQSDKGCLFAYRLDGKLVGFATVYFCFASSIAGKVAVLNDLYILDGYRRKGIGKALIRYCEKFGRSKGAARLQWLTAADNTQAQSLYRSLGAKQSSWEFFIYAP